MAVRLTKKDKEKLRRINNNVRRKNKQMENYGVDIYVSTLPIAKVTSRKQLNDYYDRARRYTRGYAFKYKKNKYGVVASNIEIARANRLAQDVSRQRLKRFMKIAPNEFKSRGQGIGSSVMQRKLMGDDRFSMYDPVKLNFSSLRSRTQFENRIERFKEQLSSDYIDKKNQQLKDNIIRSMSENWGKAGKKAIDFIKGLSPDEVLSEFMSEDVFDFSYIYDRTRVNRQIEIFEATYNL